MLQRDLATIAPQQLGRRRRLTWLIAALIVSVLVILGAMILPHTKLLPANLRQPNPPPFLKARSRDARWQQDVQYLANELPRLHVDAFHSITRAEFQAQVAALQTNIPDLNDDEIVLRLMALVASIGDGHTTLNYTAFYQGSVDGQGENGWHLYPLSIAWLEGNWYVVGTAATHAQFAGAQLLAIDDVPINGIFARVAAEVSADNDMQRRSGVAPLLVTAEVLHTLGITTQAEQARFRFMLPDGQPQESILEAVAPAMLHLQGLQLPAQEIPLALQNPERWYWYTPLPEDGALYFQYDVCGEMADQPFAEFSDELFEAVDHAELTRIVVDLRNNGGGDSAVLSPFLAGLAARPELNVYVLIGRRTFSSALMNAIELDQQANALLVGEATGGRPNHYGEVRSIKLPNSQIQVSYATKYFRMLPDADPPALEPELATPVTIANQITGYDAALTAALTALPIE